LDIVLADEHRHNLTLMSGIQSAACTFAPHGVPEIGE